MHAWYQWPNSDGENNVVMPLCVLCAPKKQATKNTQRLHKGTKEMQQRHKQLGLQKSKKQMIVKLSFL